MTTSRRPLAELRSQRWFAADTIRAFAHRQRMQQTGLRRDDFLGKPVIAIVNTWSDLSTCHAHLRERAEAVKRGVWQAGGFPVELPALSLGEVVVKPTTMLYRNLLAMETEELLRSHPVDGAVLLGGCDKTTPGLLMGAISMDLPAIYCPAGPMSTGFWRGREDRRRHPHQEVLGRAAARPHHAGRLDRARGTDDPHRGHLQHDGHRVDDDVDRRRARLHAARRVVDSRRRLRPCANGRRLRRAHGRDGVGRPHAVAPAHPRVVRQRDGRLHGAGRLDQRRGPPDRDRAPGAGAADARRHGRGRARHAGARQPVPDRRLPDGGLLVRRRPARIAVAAARRAGARRADRQRPHAGREPRRRPGVERRRDPPAGAPGHRRPGHARRAGRAARQPRAARRRDQAFGGDAGAAASTADRRSCSTTTPSSRRASTTRT